MGTYDEAWQSNRAPYLPEDFDMRFFNAAHQDLIYPGYIKGGEAVHITHMHPEGGLHFELPRVALSAKVIIGDQVEQPVLNMETLILDPNYLRVEMVWKTKVPCDKKSLKIREINLSLKR